MDKLKQKYYPDLELDNDELDIIVIWQHGKDESQVLHIERERVDDFIDMLRKAVGDATHEQI